MAGAGNLNKPVTFEREVQTPDNSGGYAVGWREIVSCWGMLVPERGREMIAADRIESPQGATLTVYSSDQTRALTTGDRAVVDGVVWNLRAIANPDQRDRLLEIVVEKGVAT